MKIVTIVLMLMLGHLHLYSVQLNNWNLGSAKASGHAIRDLNALSQDFVIETKKIEIPGFPEAFNPSIVRWKNKLLMSFRTYDPLTLSTDAIGLVWLDDHFNPISKPTLLIREGETTCNPSKAQDPRLITVGKKLFIVYSNLYPLETPTSRMFIGQIKMDSEDHFIVSFPSPLIYYDGEIANRKEKNWTPFTHHDKLMLAYSLQPHRLFVPDLKRNKCIHLVDTIGMIKWSWGDLRGGTPALMIDGQYLAFFHSNKAMQTLQSGGEMMNHYFMGAYTFSAEYPFALTGISKDPIVAKSFYEGTMYNTWKPLRVVFPGGFILDNNYLWVVYGRQDHEAWVVKLDKTKLLKSLKPITTVQE